MDDFPRRLSELLSQLSGEVETEWEALPAAVLVPLYLEGSEWNLLYTRRTDLVDVHRGQVAFPGGRIEPSDRSAAEAAQRESEEEIGLRAADVQVLGQLNPLITVTQFMVTPVIGVIPWPYPLRPNHKEVAKCFGVPIRWLAEPANLEVHSRQPLVPGLSVQVYYFKPYEGEVIWGVTGRITKSLLDLLAGSPA
ncbi:MAG: NUDIX hydrolase [Anaerolineales bacterium]